MRSIPRVIKQKFEKVTAKRRVLKWGMILPFLVLLSITGRAQSILDKAAIERKSKEYNLKALEDEFKELSDRSAPDSAVVWLASRIAYMNVEKDITQAIRFTEIAKAYLGDSPDEGFVIFSFLGRTYEQAQIPFTAIEMYNLAFKVGLKEPKLSSGLAYLATDIGNLYFSRNDYITARNYYIKGVELLEGKLNTWSEHDAYALNLNNLGLVCIELGPNYYPEAEAYFSRSTNIRQKIKNFSGLALNYIYLARVNSYLKRINLALHYTRMAGEIFKRDPDMVQKEPYVYQLFLDASCIQHLANGSVDSSLLYGKEYLDFAIKQNDKYDILTAQSVFAKTLIKAGRFDEAYDLIQKALKSAREFKRVQVMRVPYFALVTYWKEKGDLKKALEVTSNYTLLVDSIYIEHSQRKLLEIDKNAQINLIREDFTKLEKELSRQKASNNYLFILAAVILVAKVALIFALVKLRTVNKELKRTKQQVETNTDNLDALINNSNDFIWSVDNSLRYVILNKRSLIEFDQFAGYSIWPGADALVDSMTDEQREFWSTAYNRAFSGEKFMLEYENDRGVYQVSFNPIIDKGGVSGVAVFCKEFTETATLYDTIRQNEARLKAILENANASIWAVDGKYRCIFMNSHFGEWAKQVYRMDVKINDNLVSAISASRTAQFFKGIYDRGLAGENFRLEWEEKSDEEVFATYELQVSPIFNTDGSIGGVTLLVIDITDRKRVESEITRAKNYLEFAQKLAKMGNWRIDFSTGKVSWSDEMYRIYNRESSYPLPSFSQYFNTLVHYEDMQLVQERINHCIQTGEEVTFIHRLDVNGKTKWAQEIVKCFYDNEHKPIELFGTIVDITDIKEAETRLSETSIRLVQATRAAGMMVWEWQTFDNIILYDEANLEMFELPKDVPVTYEQFSNRLVDDAEREYVRDFLDQVFKSGDTEYNFSFKIKKPSDGKVYHVAASALLFRDSNNQVNRVIGLNWDITKDKEKEQQLLQAKERAEYAAQAKTLFLSTMSHEIRTPLNAVIGTAHLLMQEVANEEQREHLENLNFASQNLLRLINDILDYNKIESGRIALEKTDFRLQELVTNLVASNNYKATENSVGLKLHYDEVIPQYLLGDPMRISQILNNLISNALKFTSVGEVSVTVRSVSAQDDLINIYFEIKDTGIGIAKENQLKIFEIFSQADASTTRKYGGTGLGLAITKLLIEQHDSQLNVESEPGVGTKFFFTIGFKFSKRLTQDANVVELHATSRSLKGHNILVVDDNDMNLKMVQKFLSKWEAGADLARSGKEAIEKAEGKMYDVILMDLQMPEMDGVEATKHIRALSGGRYDNVPIIALTANVAPDVKEMVNNAGMNGLVSKPFNPDHLLDTMLASIANGVE